MVLQKLMTLEFFHEDTGIAINNNNMAYNKTQERTDMSKQLKNRSFHPPQDHSDKLKQYISSAKTELSTYATKSISFINKTSQLMKNQPSKIYKLIKILLSTALIKEGK